MSNEAEFDLCKHCGEEKALHAGFNHKEGKCLLDLISPYMIRTDAANAARERMRAKQQPETVVLSPRQEMRAKVVNILAAYYHDQISIGAVEAILDAIGLKNIYGNYPFNSLGGKNR